MRKNLGGKCICHQSRGDHLLDVLFHTLLLNVYIINQCIFQNLASKNRYWKFESCTLIVRSVRSRYLNCFYWNFQNIHFSSGQNIFPIESFWDKKLKGLYCNPSFTNAANNTIRHSDNYDFIATARCGFHSDKTKNGND